MGHIMKTGAGYLSIILVAGCHRKLGNVSATNRASSTEVAASGPRGIGQSNSCVQPGLRANSSSRDSTWSKGLTNGVNGPIPLIVVDQFGYRTAARKVAVIRDPKIGYDNSVDFEPGSTYAVVDKATGNFVKKGAPTPWKNGATDSSSGDRVWWFDFSDVERPGIYTVVDVDKHVRSVEFDVNDEVYERVLKAAVRMFYFQRAGFAKSIATVGDNWADAASHLGPGQDGECRSWLAKGDAKQARDLRGGWFDAGDYNKYTSWAARNVIMLLRAFQENASAFGDDFGIAESGNGIPDIIDEVKWALDWLKRMQLEDGSMLSVQGLATASPPSEATGPSYYGPPTTGATLMGSAAFAYAAKILAAQVQPQFKTYAIDLSRRSSLAWAWANLNPRVLYFNNDNSRQAGSSGLAAGQQEMDDSERLFTKFEAATYLYELTHDMSFREFAELNYTEIVPSSGPNQWTAERQEALLYYAALPGVSPSVKDEIVGQFVKNVSINADQLPMVTNNDDPYRAPIKEYEWGSNKSKTAQARIYQLLGRFVSRRALAELAAAAAEEYVHYIHGVNPLGLVYLTNMKCLGAEHSTKTMFHNWFSDGSVRWDEVTDQTPGPAPGYLVGGPNRHFSLDACCAATFPNPGYRCYNSSTYSLCGHKYSPPLGQPDQKAYLQFNAGWPANSWAITEPSTGYQAQYVRLLSAFVR